MVCMEGEGRRVCLCICEDEGYVQMMIREECTQFSSACMHTSLTAFFFPPSSLPVPPVLSIVVCVVKLKQLLIPPHFFFLFCYSPLLFAYLYVCVSVCLSMHALRTNERTRSSWGEIRMAYLCSGSSPASCFEG